MSNAPIIVVSANAFDKGRKNAASIRNEDFLVKPVNVVELLELIRERLDLQWVPAAPAVPAVAALPAADPQQPAVAPLPATADVVLPGADLLRSLHELGSLGYVRGILDKLGEIELLDPSYAVFTGTLRAHVERFDLPEYLRYLDRTMQANSDATS